MDRDRGPDAGYPGRSLDLVRPFAFGEHIVRLLLGWPFDHDIVLYDGNILNDPT